MEAHGEFKHSSSEVAWADELKKSKFWFLWYINSYLGFTSYCGLNNGMHAIGTVLDGIKGNRGVESVTEKLLLCTYQ